jgi:hypothetical protein
MSITERFVYASAASAKTLSKPVSRRDSLRDINKKKSRPIGFSENFGRSVFVRLLVQTDRAMKLPGVSLILATLGAVSVTGQYITLEIPHDDHNELHQASFPTFTSKKYYFVTYFKVKQFLKAKVQLDIDKKCAKTSFRQTSFAPINTVNSTTWSC